MYDRIMNFCDLVQDILGNMLTIISHLTDSGRNYAFLSRNISCSRPCFERNQNNKKIWHNNYTLNIHAMVGNVIF